ncbi:hypothetical protein M9Y10_030033 [Tritrichomonas musculus]|uniref:AB hydrolase-1 domain-containing protein n=1 Tax=Tritrichomonas musculus TaxID=1915356 RepID=A0ABR2KS54_9EUKA
MHYFTQGEKDIVSKIPYGNNPSAAHYVQADDAKIYYEVYGKGEPCLVIHGGGVGCTYEMGRFIDELSKHYLVIAPSSRGHGKSEIGTKRVTYEQKANDFMAVVNDVTKDQFIICGFSDGAYASYKIASMHPDRVKKIIAIGAGENIPGLRKIPLNKLEDFAKIDENYIKEKIALCPEPEKLQSFLDDNLTFFNNETISKQIFNSIQCPTLLMCGELDGNAPLDTVLNAYKMIPKAQLAVIANAPHTVFLTNFDAVWANIKPFLNL